MDENIFCLPSMALHSIFGWDFSSSNISRLNASRPRTLMAIKSRLKIAG